MEAFIASTALVTRASFLGRTPRARKAREENSPCPLPRRSPTAKLPDVAVIGGGLAGLSTAYELVQRGATVRVLTTPTRRPAGLAAAGMLAPSLERLSGPLRTLCDHSLHAYPRLISRLQGLVPGADLRFVSLPDFLRPYFSWEDVCPSDEVLLLPASQARIIEPRLSPDVVAVHRFRGQAHVDNRALMATLRAACETLGVVFSDDGFVRRLALVPGAAGLDGVTLKSGEVVHAGHYVLASGAWSGSLLPGLPLRPVKGQMLSLRPPQGEESMALLHHVLHCKQAYIVPKMDGKEFFIGATMEEGTFDLANTARGVSSLLNAAIRIVPSFEHYEVSETWSGVRPSTPDGLPVLGMSEISNLSIATGYFRNGFLLAPAAAKIAAATALGEVDSLPQDLRGLVGHFSAARFLGESGYDSINSPVHDEVHVPSQVPLSRRANTKKEIQNKSKIVEQKTDSRAKEAQNSTAKPSQQIMMWRVSANGSMEPVYPSKQFHRSSNASTPESPTAEPMDEPPSPAKEASGENDAYEDVMQHRGEDEAKIMREALAANRAFGRKRSSLEADGGPPLSLNEEEVKLFDAALQQGLDDFKETEELFEEKRSLHVPDTINGES